MKKVLFLVLIISSLFAHKCGEYFNNHFFDATDGFKSIYIDRSISTKIVNKPFYLKIFASHNGYPCELDGIRIRYNLFDVSNGVKIPGTSDKAEIFQRGVMSKRYTINRAYRNVKVAFHVCSYFNGVTYKLHPYNDCRRKECKDDTQFGRCIRTIYSNDAFAIRPNRFKIYVKGAQRSGSNMHHIKIEAVGWRGRPAKGYNVSSRDLLLYVKDDNYRTPRLKYSFRFSNGIAHIYSLKYPDAGNIRLGITERKGRKFARIDDKDQTFVTLDEHKHIGVNIAGALSKHFVGLPDHFDIEVLKMPEFGYFSNDLSQEAAVLKLAIIAKSRSNHITRNYLGDLDVDITHNGVAGDVSSIRTQYGSFNHNENIKFTTDSSVFSRGKMILNLKIDFDRQQRPMNEVKLRLGKIIVKDSHGVKGELNLNKTIRFRYGRVMIDRVTTLSENVMIPVKFMYYNNGNWVENDLHNSAKDGSVNKVYTKGKVEIGQEDLNKDQISGGLQNINGIITTLKRPYETMLHFDISPWLWYSQNDIPYDKPSEYNTDCNTHPCLKIKVENPSYHW